MSKKVIPSPPQSAALRNIANGNPPSHGLVGRSAHGVFSKTLNSLWRREWIGCHKGALYLTAAGQAALDRAQAQYLAWEAELARQLAHDADLRRAIG